MKITVGRLIIVAATLVAGGLVYWWCQHRLMPAPQAIQIALDDAVEGAESNDIDLIMRHVSKEFRGEFGGETIDRRGLRQRLFILLRRDIRVEIVTQDVEEHDELATVTLVVAMWGGGLSGAASGDATAREIELDFRVEDNDWKVVEARHRPAEIQDVF